MEPINFESLPINQQKTIIALCNLNYNTNLNPNDLNDPNSPAYKEMVKAVAINLFVREISLMQLVSLIGRKINNKPEKTVSTTYIQQPEPKLNFKKITIKSKLTTDPLIVSLVRDLNAAIVQFNQVKQQVVQANQALQVAQNKLNVLNKQVEIADKLQAASTPTKAINLLSSTIIPQLSDIMGPGPVAKAEAETGVVATPTLKPSMIRPYQNVATLHNQQEKQKTEVDTKTAQVDELMPQLNNSINTINTIVVRISNHLNIPTPEQHMGALFGNKQFLNTMLSMRIAMMGDRREADPDNRSRTKIAIAQAVSATSGS